MIGNMNIVKMSRSISRLFNEQKEEEERERTRERAGEKNIIVWMTSDFSSVLVDI
jgi:hypothetical protein